MKAIRTKYLGPTDTKGSRIKADDGDGNSITVPQNYDLDSGANHEAAAKALCDKLNWEYPTQCGWFGNDCFHTFSNGEVYK